MVVALVVVMVVAVVAAAAATMKRRSEVTQTLRADCTKADSQTNKQTRTQIDRGDYSTLRSLARSVP